MFDEYNPLAKIPENSKAGITVCLPSGEDDEPFEATVYFRKSGKSPEELRNDDALIITASGKLRLDIGKKGYVEIFGENSAMLKNAGDEGEKEEDDDAVPLL
jgi:hypothetical protein